MTEFCGSLLLNDVPYLSGRRLYVSKARFFFPFSKARFFFSFSVVVQSMSYGDGQLEEGMPNSLHLMPDVLHYFITILIYFS